VVASCRRALEIDASRAREQLTRLKDELQIERYRLEAAFRTFDPDGMGSLDPLALSKCASFLGIGQDATKLLLSKASDCIARGRLQLDHMEELVGRCGGLESLLLEQAVEGKSGVLPGSLVYVRCPDIRSGAQRQTFIVARVLQVEEGDLDGNVQLHVMAGGVSPGIQIVPKSWIASTASVELLQSCGIFSLSQHLWIANRAELETVALQSMTAAQKCSVTHCRDIAIIQHAKALETLIERCRVLGLDRMTVASMLLWCRDEAPLLIPVDLGTAGRSIELGKLPDCSSLSQPARPQQPLPPGSSEMGLAPGSLPGAAGKPAEVNKTPQTQYGQLAPPPNPPSPHTSQQQPMREGSAEAAQPQQAQGQREDMLCHYDEKLQADGPHGAVLDLMDDCCGAISEGPLGTSLSSSARSYLVVRGSRARTNFAVRALGRSTWQPLLWTTGTPDACAHLLLGWTDDALLELASVARGQPLSVGRIGGRSIPAYVHGKVDLRRDIAQIIVHNDHRQASNTYPEATVRALCNSMGWELVWMSDERHRRDTLACNRQNQLGSMLAIEMEEVLTDPLVMPRCNQLRQRPTVQDGAGMARTLVGSTRLEVTALPKPLLAQGGAPSLVVPQMRAATASGAADQMLPASQVPGPHAMDRLPGGSPLIPKQAPVPRARSMGVAALPEQMKDQLRMQLHAKLAVDTPIAVASGYPGFADSATGLSSLSYRAPARRAGSRKKKMRPTSAGATRQLNQARNLPPRWGQSA